jgi:hypothetical protein
MNRIHNSELPILRVRRKPVSQTYIYHKPQGFWYAIGNVWIKFLEDRKIWRVGDYNYSVDTSKANILILYSEAKMLEFTERYKDGKKTAFINWDNVAKNYDGIEIPIFMKGLDSDPRTCWYYNWDVASGCVWNMQNIKIKPYDEKTKRTRKATQSKC